MKNPATQASQQQHTWSKDALLAKAQRFAEEMLKHPRDDWRFAMWSTLVLELLGRAALAKVNLALLADPKDWNNLYYSLGFNPTANKFIPKSVDITTVFNRLRDILPAFTIEMEGFAVLHMARRNEELHAGSTPFDSLKTNAWLPNYYHTCTILVESIGEKLDFLFGTDEAELATKMIAASRDELAKAVLKSVSAHKTIWEDKPEPEREKLSRQAQVWATRHDGHRVICPSCGSDGIVTGAAIAAPLRNLDGDLMVETQQYLPSKFECVACQLKIAGFSQLTACGLGSPYKATFSYDLADYYAPNCVFRFNPATVPTGKRPLFRPESGRHSVLKAAGIPVNPASC